METQDSMTSELHPNTIRTRDSYIQQGSRQGIAVPSPIIAKGEVLLSDGNTGFHDGRAASKHDQTRGQLFSAEISTRDSYNQNDLHRGIVIPNAIIAKAEVRLSQETYVTRGFG